MDSVVTSPGLRVNTVVVSKVSIFGILQELLGPIHPPRRNGFFAPGKPIWALARYDADTAPMNAF
jgi:hypothetical protein